MKPITDTIYLLQHVANVLERQSDQVLSERLGIGMAQYRIMVLLQETPEIEQRRLADSLGQTEASISRQMKLLLERGMVVSVVDPHERRRHVAALTTKGQKIAHAAREVLQQYHEPVADQLTDKQKAQLRDIMPLLHEQVCVPGKPIACDRPADIRTLYEINA